MTRFIKVHIFWEGHKIFRNLHLTFVLCSASQKSKVEISQNFVAFSEYINFKQQSLHRNLFYFQRNLFRNSLLHKTSDDVLNNLAGICQQILVIRMVSDDFFTYIPIAYHWRLTIQQLVSQISADLDSNIWQSSG